jgi:hypothetical protein
MKKAISINPRESVSYFQDKQDAGWAAHCMTLTLRLCQEVPGDAHADED